MTPLCCKVVHLIVPSPFVGSSHQRYSSSASSSSSSSAVLTGALPLLFFTGVDEDSALTGLASFFAAGAFFFRGASGLDDSCLMPFACFLCADDVDFAAFLSFLAIVAASFSAFFSILDFSAASFLPSGISESDSPICWKLARGGFCADPFFSFAFETSGASSESDSTALVCFVATLRRLL